MRESQRKITLPPEQKKQMLEEIVRYFEAERRETIGNMEALLIYDFFMETIGPHVYNQGILDAYSQVSGRLEDLYALLFPV